MPTKIKDFSIGDEAWVKCKVTCISTDKESLFVKPVGAYVEDDIHFRQSHLDKDEVKALTQGERYAKLAAQLEEIKEKIRCLGR